MMELPSLVYYIKNSKFSNITLNLNSFLLNSQKKKLSNENLVTYTSSYKCHGEDIVLLNYFDLLKELNNKLIY